METEEKELELRMYFFTIYQLTGMQGGIQSGHSALRFALKYGRYNPNHIIWDFIEKYETWIVLNGGTTNDEIDIDNISVGTLNQIGDSLQENDIEFTHFREPDLNHSLTALCFIVNEQVFNKKDYPDFLDYILHVKMYPNAYEHMPQGSEMYLRMKTNEELEELFPEYYKEWVRFVGGVKNVFLRELLKGKKLA